MQLLPICISLYFSLTASMPSLRDFECTVTQPYCNLNFQLNSGAETNDSVSVKVTREQLDYMIEGMGKIRDQLFAAASV